MITNEELMERIEAAIKDYRGDIQYLNEAVGMIVVGRLLGWEHQRMVVPRKCWTFATQLFGDPKSPTLMPKRGKYWQKSRALYLADKFDGYLNILKRSVSLSEQEKDERKMMI